MAGVRLRGVHKHYGKVHAVRGVDIDIPDRAFTVLVGPSGCGKSTLLRMIAGLEEVTEGTVEIDGAVVNDVRPKDRDVAMVFQNYALYPHMSVFENVAFGSGCGTRPPPRSAPGSSAPPPCWGSRSCSTASRASSPAASASASPWGAPW